MSPSWTAREMAIQGAAVEFVSLHRLTGCEGLRIMVADSLDDYIEAVATALALPVEAAWKPAVKANLEVSLRLAGLVDEFLLPDETEPANVFTA